MSDARIKYILGLDLGVASVGWAVVPCDYSQISEETLIMGARVFKAGSNLTKARKVQSPNVNRRQKRGIRRNIWRRRRRAVKLFNILQNAHFLPSTSCHTPEARLTLFNELDVDLKKRYFPFADHVTSQTFLYKLRARALDEPLDLDAIGRVFYMLGQRRGFLSNKKARQTENDEKSGIVNTSITNLGKAMKERGSRTLGEYFATLDPEEKECRIRSQYVGRQDYIKEYEMIWNAQCKFRPDIYTPALKQKIFKAIFSQRRLKSQKSLVSKCRLEPSRRCIIKGDPLYQEFRCWQDVLNLEVFDPSIERDRWLTPEEQDIVIDMLENAEDVKFDSLRKALNFKDESKDKRNWRFNFEIESKKTIPGNKTRSRICKVLAKTGAPELIVDEIDRIAAEILFYEYDEALALKLSKLYPNFSEDTIEKLSQITLDSEYSNLSRKAIKRLLPLMQEKRMRYDEACGEIYGEESSAHVVEKSSEVLKSVNKTLGDVRNPTVVRALTEMRKVVNAIIRRYGKPECIRIELARDLKLGSKAREEILIENSRREKERKDYEEKIRAVMGEGYRVTSEDILKYRLAVECNWQCPYTGKYINEDHLFGSNSEFNIEHIIPLSISFDDSFANKTLCDAYANQQVKRNQTPFQCYGETEKWIDILDRVRGFVGPCAKHKLALFKMEDFSQYDETPSHLLNDTRYISKLAREYLGTLYSAGSRGVDPNGKTRVQIALGTTTAWIRNALDLNTVLLKPKTEYGTKEAQGKNNDLAKKNRDDHRHHAVDALVVALTDSSMIQYMSRHADDCYDYRGKFLREKFTFLTQQCPSFRAIVTNVVEGIIVSHRVDRKVSGGFHDETNYSAKMFDEKRVSDIKIRRQLTSISKDDVDNIVDSNIQHTVKEKWEEIDYKPGKFEGNWPVLPVRNCTKRANPIKSVRTQKNVKIEKIGKDWCKRFVSPGDNHHLEVYAELDDLGKEVKWVSKVVSLLDAYKRRVSDDEHVIKRDFGPKTRFKFSLAKGEALTMNDGHVYNVDGISEDQRENIELELVLHSDARLRNERKRIRYSSKNGNFLKLGIGKLHIDVLGNIHPAND